MKTIFQRCHIRQLTGSICEAHSLHWLGTNSLLNDIAPHTPYMSIKNLGSFWKRTHSVQQKAGYQSYPVPPESASIMASYQYLPLPLDFPLFPGKNALECCDMLRSRTAHILRPTNVTKHRHTHPVLPLPFPFPFPLFFPLLFPLPLPPLPPPSKAYQSLASNNASQFENNYNTKNVTEGLQLSFPFFAAPAAKLLLFLNKRARISGKP